MNVEIVIIYSVYWSHVFIQQEIARHLRPTTLRALYGKDKVKNGVHCTDLPEDGILEVGDTCTLRSPHTLHIVYLYVSSHSTNRFTYWLLAHAYTSTLCLAKNKTQTPWSRVLSLVLWLHSVGQGNLRSHWFWREQEWQRNLKQNHCFSREWV